MEISLFAHHLKSNFAHRSVEIIEAHSKIVAHGPGLYEIIIAQCNNNNNNNNSENTELVECMQVTQITFIFQ